MIKDFKEVFRSLEPWKKGMPKRANNVTMYTKKYNRQLKGPGSNATLYKLDALKNESENKMIPGHVRASINWNNLLFANSDNYSPKIMDGAKVVVCRLKNNPNELYKCSISQMKCTCPIGSKNCLLMKKVWKKSY